jgi:hypothetical protein
MLTSPDELFAYGFGEDYHREVPFVLRREGDSKAATTHTNPTFLPDDFLLAMQPVFQIRHPVLMFPSLVRAQAKVLPNSRPSVPRLVVTLTLRGSRALFDWCLNHPAALSPKVIDADDIMKDREAARSTLILTLFSTNGRLTRSRIPPRLLSYPRLPLRRASSPVWRLGALILRLRRSSGWRNLGRWMVRIWLGRWRLLCRTMSTCLAIG